MRSRLALVMCVLFWPLAAPAAEPPERLLSAGTQVYLRWDGIDAHQEAYARTALGKVLQGETGTFLTKVFEQVQEGLGTLLTVEQLLGGANPEELRKMEADAAEAGKLLRLIGKHGFILAIELQSVEPPRGQVTLILPGVGPKPAPLFGVLRLAAGLSKQKINTQKINGRSVSSLMLPPLTLAWWAEGDDAVLRLGLGPVQAVVQEPKAQLVDQPLFKRVQSFDRFPTGARGFVDIAGLVKHARGRGKEVDKLLDDLGINSLKSIVLYSGFDGDSERGLVEVDIPGPRKGIFRLLQGKQFQLADVPPIPPDVVSWSMSNFNLAQGYDAAVEIARQVTRIVEPDSVKEIDAALQRVNATLGIDLRKDLLGSLGDRYMEYNSPSEGPFTLGYTILLEVRDAEKLDAALQQVIKTLANLANGQVQIKKRTYRGATLREVHVRQQGFFFIPTYAIHKGKTGTWLAVSFFPQPVKGFIARSRGELEAWKPSPRVQRSLKSLPDRYIAITYNDPRPTINQVFSVAPIIGGLINSLNPEINLDVGSMPTAQEVTRHLFPNVSVVSDDGQTLRLESRESLALPMDLVGLDTYTLFILYGLAGVGF
jgi:hypothetical protein